MSVCVCVCVCVCWRGGVCFGHTAGQRVKNAPTDHSDCPGTAAAAMALNGVCRRRPSAVLPPVSPGAGVRTHRAAAAAAVVGKVGAAVEVGAAAMAAATETGSDQPVGDQAAATRFAAGCGVFF